MLTYGDGVSDVNIPELVDFHIKSGKTATVTAIQPSGKYGSLKIEDDNRISSFLEKPIDNGAWISGGFFVLEPNVFEYIKNDDAVIFEREPLEQLAADNELNAYKHTGFWKAMDTLKDKIELTNMWTHGDAPWTLWLKK
jgi:glucose-1-phosphate cytidylyltransferase